MENNSEYKLNNYLTLKALEETDKKLAIQCISDPLLDGKELSDILAKSLLGSVVYKKSGESVKISNDVIMAGFINKINQIERDLNKEYE